ncbi:cell division protein FtsL [Candidatus Thiosymbion oneisti]|uniref:cell division protein FtsL n=1 Tax=Candidatus Thiosymbion oneisti TaxID=589554 RepID=UPI000B7D58AC|nr:cell division protein FtsL [Candidatus Thiosymbion oneisti]
MTRYELWFLLLLIAGTVGTGIGIVYTKYLSRVAFVELQALHAERQKLEVRWGQLRLEEAALTTHPRIETKARKLLGMYLPRSEDVRMIGGER